MIRVPDKWTDYELIDCTCGERLERWGDKLLIRPDPQVVWQSEKNSPLWNKADARYVRSSTGGGEWEYRSSPLKPWAVRYGELTFNVKPMGFKHTGVFPEQAVNWELISGIIRASSAKLRVLNLFAYTGAATVSALKAGASVVHVDAAKGMVAWAKENASSSGVADREVRWIVDDCAKFVAREIRRESKYDIIIMDPPSYGRGPNSEVWHIEDEIYGLVKLCTGVLSDNPAAVLINSYTAGLSPSTMGYILSDLMDKRFGGKVFSSETGLRVSSTGLALPCGGSAVWQR